MSGDPPESHFFSAEIDDDVSSGIADQEHLKTKFPSIVPDLIGISTDGPGVSTFNHAERTKLFNLFESIQSSTTSHNASEQDDDVPGQISVDLAGRAKPTIQEESGAAQDFNFVNISEDVAIKAEEVDEEPLGGIAVTLIDESLDEVPRIPRHPPKRVENRLSDVSDEEKDRFPPARYRSGLEELVDCKCFRNGSGRASSAPAETLLPRESFTNGTAARDRGVILLPRDERRNQLENLKKLKFSQATKCRMKERYCSSDLSARRKRRYHDENDPGNDRERSRGDIWPQASEHRSGRDNGRAERDDQAARGSVDNGLEDLSNNPSELQRRCIAHIALSENQAANVNDDQLLSAVIETLYLLINAQRLCRKRKKLLLEMKVMRQDEVDMMKVIHADLPAHLQSVVRIEGDNVFINEAGFRCLPSSTTSAPFSRFPSSAVPHAMYLNPGTVPPVDMPPFIAAPCIPPIVPSKSTVSSMPPSTPSGSETSAAPVVVPPPAQPVSPDLSLGTELIRSSFMSSTYSHPSPISSGPNFSASLHIHPSSPAAVVTRLPDFSRPPPSIRPVSETSKCSLLKTTSSSVLTDVAVATNTESAPPAIAPTTVPPPNAALPLNMNVPPPNVHSGSGTFKAPYMQSPSFLGPLSGTSNTAHVQDFTKTITNMITSALKAPMDAGVNAFGARSRVRTYVGPGISLIGNFSPPLNAHDNDGSGEVDWTSGPRVFQYRSESCHDKRQEKQSDCTTRPFDPPVQS